MFKRTRRSGRDDAPQYEDWQEGGESYPPEEAYPPEEGYYPPEGDDSLEAMYDATDAGYAPEEGYDAPAEDGYGEEGYWEQEPLDDMPLPEEKPRSRSIFKPAVRKPNFVLCVLVNVVRILALLVLVVGLAGLGAVAGVAKGYMETAPTLDLAALDDQAQTSFIYDSNGNLITEYKGIENRVMVSIAAMPKYLQQAFVAVEDAP